jgi:hypothetical protein
MTTAQWISMIFFATWPLAWHLMAPVAQYIIQRFPTGQFAALKDFAEMAVKQVEQQNKNLTGEAKKQIAMSLVIRLFKVFKRPLPPEEIVNAAIEAVVIMLPKSGK